ncbi:hypothetical protein J7K93_02920 [bacterium]|nr:hypothetical protein [bacterium]
MSVEHIPPGSGLFRASKNYFDAKKNGAKPVKNKEGAKTSGSDKVEISRQARDLNKKNAILADIKEAYAKLREPEARQDKVKQAATRVITGFYNRGSVQQKTAESMLNFSPVMDKTSHTQSVYSDKAESEDISGLLKIKQVQKRIIDNYYDSIDVIKKVVDKLLNS